MNKEKKKCIGCHYFEPHKTGPTGDCHKFPAQVTHIIVPGKVDMATGQRGLQASPLTAWPQHQADTWCGEWEKREPETL